MAELDGRLVLVFDWGGGTLDLTLCRVTEGALIQVQNAGDDKVGGDRFDERLMRLVADRHAGRWNLPIEVTLLPGAQAKLNAACEGAKIRLSRQPAAKVGVANYANVEGGGRSIDETITIADVESVAFDLIQRGLTRIDEMLRHVGIPVDAIDMCLATGGMVQMPVIRTGLIERFGGSGRVPLVENGDQVIAEGAAWIASDMTPLTLAKPFEVLHADNSYISLFDANDPLPTQGNTVASSFAMYCVDPRDGFARFLFGRPASPDRIAQGDPRDPYGIVILAVDPNARPLHERLELSVTIDSDLVAHVDVQSSLAKDHRRMELHGLEFGLRLL